MNYPLVIVKFRDAQMKRPFAILGREVVLLLNLNRQNQNQNQSQNSLPLNPMNH